MLRNLLISLVLANLLLASGGGPDLDGYRTLEYRLWDANRIRFWIGNNGSLVTNIPTGDAGLEWPKGSGNTAVFASGLWVAAGIVDGENDIRTAICEYSSEFRPGDLGSDSADPKHQLFIINRGDDENYSDWRDWPADLGAPWNDLDNDGIYDPYSDEPAIKGDQFAWSIFNDGDLETHNNLFGTDPLGIEVRASTYGLDVANPYGNVVFHEWNIKNAGTHQLDSVFVSVWIDADIGDANDDYTGCRPDLNMSYAYNGDAVDQDYGTNPPAVGFMFVQTPLVPALGEIGYNAQGEVINHMNLPMSSFRTWQIGDNADPENGQEAYNMMNGLDKNGIPYTPPIGESSPFMYTGDPVTNTGWTAQNSGIVPEDFRQLMSIGPFSLAPGESQDVAGALYLLAGTTNLNALTALDYLTENMQAYWSSEFQLVGINESNHANLDEFRLHQGFPNPFNPSITIQYDIPELTDLQIMIHDISGREVWQSQSGEKWPGSYSFQWDGQDAQGEQVSTGLYLISLKGLGLIKTQKVLLLR